MTEKQQETECCGLTEAIEVYLEAFRRADQLRDDLAREEKRILDLGCKIRTAIGFRAFVIQLDGRMYSVTNVDDVKLTRLNSPDGVQIKL